MIDFEALNAPYRYVTLLAASCAAWIGIGVIRVLDPYSSANTLTQHGILDETGHILTALMIAVGLKALKLPIPIWSVLIGGMVLDVQSERHALGSGTRSPGSDRLH